MEITNIHFRLLKFSKLRKMNITFINIKKKKKNWNVITQMLKVTE